MIKYNSRFELVQVKSTAFRTIVTPIFLGTSPVGLGPWGIRRNNNVRKEFYKKRWKGPRFRLMLLGYVSCSVFLAATLQNA
jgi:hypothetical protein